MVELFSDRLHRQVEAGYMEALAELTTTDDFVGDKNYPKALESLDYALEMLSTMRTNLVRLTDRKHK